MSSREEMEEMSGIGRVIGLVLVALLMVGSGAAMAGDDPEEVPSASERIALHGTLQKTADGAYILNKVIFQSSIIDLEEWVGKEVVIKAEVVTTTDPGPVPEVLAICEWNSAASEAVTDGEESYDAETLRKMLGATAVEPSCWGQVKALFR